MPASEELWTTGVGRVADGFASVLRPALVLTQSLTRPAARLFGRVRWLISTEDRDRDDVRRTVSPFYVTSSVPGDV